MFGFGFGFGFKSYGSLSFAEKLAKAYRTRVEADGGTYENDACLVAELNRLIEIISPSLFNEYSGASAGFALFKLDNDYTGNCIKVRRSSDNTELDIGFASGVLDTSALLTFCGSGDGFVTTWYGQAASVDATQSTAGNQPKIVNSGVVELMDGTAAINFDAGDTLALSSAISFNTAFTQAKIDTQRVVNYILFNSTANKGIFYGGSNGPAIGLGIYDGSVHAIAGEDLLPHLGYFNFDGSDWQVGKDGDSSTNFSSGTAFAATEIGRSDFNITGPVQSIVLYTASQAANRAGIEAFL